MGKKKQKKADKTKAGSSSSGSKTCHDPNISATSKTQQSFPTFIIPLSKAMFILLSIGGKLSANDYADFLDVDEVPFDSDDDDIDEIINAIEYHEDHRLNLSKGIRQLAESILSFKSSSSSANRRDDAGHFIKIESCAQHLLSLIPSYRTVITKQRKILEELKSFLIKSSFSNFDSRDIDEKYLPLLNYGVIFQGLSRQYVRQLDWEGRCLDKISEMLVDGSIYSHLIHAGEDGKDYGHQPQNRSVSTYLQKCAYGYSQCIRLDGHHWQNVKENFVKDILSISGADASPDKNNSEADAVSADQPGTEMSEETADTIHAIIADFPVTSVPPYNMDAAMASVSIQGVINAFVDHPVFFSEIYEPSSLQDLGDLGVSAQATSSREMLFLLLEGATNSGKTYFCDQVETKITQLCADPDEQSQVVVVRPRLPADFLEPSVGAFEDSIFSLFTHIESIIKFKKCILLLDNIEHFLGTEYGDNEGGNPGNGHGPRRKDHLSFRVKNTFLAIMDRMRRKGLKSNQNTTGKGLLVICTSRSHDGGILDRFDKIFHFGAPSGIERRYLIETGLGLRRNNSIENLDGDLAQVVNATVGKSRGEIAHFCREAIEAVPFIHMENDYILRLDAIKASLQSILPESIRNNPTDGMIEMRVLSAKDLRRNIRVDENGNDVLPLLGDNAIESWKQIQNIIIAPLCRRDSLDELLFGNSGHSQILSQRKANSSGVLISGDPGVGKTALAYHCAAVAAGLNSAIRLLEVSCTSLIHKEVGGSERSLNKLFATARAAAPCILLMDGIETIAPVRGKDNTTEGTMDRLLSTLLIEMDGVGSGGNSSSKSNSIGVIGTTHNLPSWIDPALLRPGRLEKCIKLTNPDSSARKSIFLNAIADANIDFSGAGFFDPKDSIQLAEAVALKTVGRSAAEIIALYENAKMLALKEIISSEYKHLEGHEAFGISFRHFLH